MTLFPPLGVVAKSACYHASRLEPPHQHCYTPPQNMPTHHNTKHHPPHPNTPSTPTTTFYVPTSLRLPFSRRRPCAAAAGGQSDCPSSSEHDPGSEPPEQPTQGGAGHEEEEEEDVDGGEGGPHRRAWRGGISEAGGGGAGAAFREDDEGWVQLYSVTSDNPQFHPASFQPQVLPPDGETSFQASAGERGLRRER